MSVLEVADVRRAFGGIRAVDGVSLTVQQQEIVGVIGPNGSGKSTLFNLLTGVVRTDAGHIRLFDQDITKWSSHRVARAGLGRTFQVPALFTNMTVRENLLAASVEGHWTGVTARSGAVLELLHLRDVADQQASSLSGGQQRLLEMGRVLMREPRMVLLDEVTAGVHPSLRDIIVTAIRSLRDEGTTFLVIEHDMELAQLICDRIVVMDAGRVVATGTFREISHDPQVMEAYLGVPAE